MKPYVKNVVILCTIFFLAATIEVQGETIQDAVKLVLQGNPEITAVAYNRLARDQEVRQAMAGRHGGERSALGLAGADVDHRRPGLVHQGRKFRQGPRGETQGGQDQQKAREQPSHRERKLLH